MQKIKSLAMALPKIEIKSAITFASLLLVATIAPMMGLHSQWVTGPIVNATLFLSVALIGPSAGIMVGLFPSIIALGMGLLPASLAPMIPFIMVSNALLVAVYYFFQKNHAIGVIISAGVKYLFLFATSSVVINLLLKKELAVKISQMMSWSQFFTAVLGGVLAWIVLKGKEKYGK